MMAFVGSSLCPISQRPCWRIIRPETLSVIKQDLRLSTRLTKLVTGRTSPCLANFQWMRKCYLVQRGHPKWMLLGSN
ncbi:hypothetical protein H112_05852 [Trichophyton rubrum D6]|uniref:Uncharacterized protein n=2 Tax=Trichophyton TaxID=5550 RepID=A0A022VXG7_TRIRU|nr:hypothetical protein H100_05866 [Trichophyton rubrum MR850]EZF40142.1 hypothetical protein H102_05835 [Trichophyton rubrum CBS 100081]EZF50775.1 hypothetical protein H103_05863 [Trichophyton rubrum CBS 288.86]EZF61372.1 hypothetical protein H104_05849 [Trichophyton rubrum CBS 289.86]EZF72033.1 hypothetical protein H105_05876 [Trichophyton soudanense CBS 452.61]EZF82687.1 hypothetical protein H110_05857 [Trichophyton rubrum MR1448]EZF93381.1 hypothetical protein H113_05904 [Trichophyton rub